LVLVNLKAQKVDSVYR